MNQANKYVGLVDYKELESDILSSIREGRPLTGRGGALTPLIKKLLEASLEGEIENQIKMRKTTEEMVEIQRLCIQIQDHLNCSRQEIEIDKSENLPKPRAHLPA